MISGITLVVLVVTIVVLVILVAVTINTMKTNQLIERTLDSTQSYSYEQEKEFITTAVTESLLSTLSEISERIDVEFNYNDMPSKVKAILDSHNGDFMTEEIENTDDYTKYKITTRNGNTYNLKISKTTGKHEFE